MLDNMYLVEVGTKKRVLTQEEIQTLEESMIEVIILEEVDPTEELQPYYYFAKQFGFNFKQKK